ncbi:MAG: CBS domain-containing protein [Nannocystaceae bacterium]
MTGPKPLSMDSIKKLDEIANALRRGEDSPSVTVRTFLSWFEAQRRGVYVVRRIREALEAAELVTDPDFESAYIDSEIQFAATTPDAPAASDPDDDDVEASPEVRLIGGAIGDPTYRIGKLPSANKSPVYVRPGTALSEAVTKMLINDFSQLPVMQSDRNLKGIVSWTSIGSKLALGLECATVDDCMEEPREISSETSLFDAIDVIVRYQYVLIRNRERQISGIVTTSDLSLQFRQLGEPFLLLGEIENYIRSILHGRFSAEQVIEVRDPADPREISRVEDMTFGEYVRLIAKPEHWDLLGLELDRTFFIKNLDRVRQIRNDVMHFDPDGLSDDDLRFLRGFSRFMQKLRRIGVVRRPEV